MATNEEVLEPKALTMPTNTNIATGPPGMVFYSGGRLMYFSGAQLVKVQTTVN